MRQPASYYRAKLVTLGVVLPPPHAADIVPDG